MDQLACRRASVREFLVFLCSIHCNVCHRVRHVLDCIEHTNNHILFMFKAGGTDW